MDAEQVRLREVAGHQLVHMLHKTRARKLVLEWTAPRLKLTTSLSDFWLIGFPRGRWVYAAQDSHRGAGESEECKLGAVSDAVAVAASRPNIAKYITATDGMAAQTD